MDRANVAGRSPADSMSHHLYTETTLSAPNPLNLTRRTRRCSKCGTCPDGGRRVPVSQRHAQVTPSATPERVTEAI
jgi:hypothetical protein